MEPQLTSKPFRAVEDAASAQSRYRGGREETMRPDVAGVAGTGREPEHTMSRQTAATTPRDADIDAALAAIAVAMSDDRSRFLQALGHSLGAEVSPAMRRKLLRAGAPRCEEMTALSSLVGSAIQEAKPAAAAVIGAALAARIVGCSLLRDHIPFGAADREALLSAWLDAARAIVAVRGPDGLRRLMPAAVHLVRRPRVVGKSAAEIAAATRRVAARITVEPPRDRACDRPAELAIPLR